MKFGRQIIYESPNFIAVNKPAGILVHQTSISKEKTLVDELIEEYPEIGNVGDEPKLRPGIVHRLDKDTSGVLIIARNQVFFDYLKGLFQKHEVKKIYVALVHGQLKPGRGVIEKPISLKPGTTRRTVHGGKLTKEAVTEYRVIEYFRDFSLVELMPKTGRTHQLRIHLASINHPVVGDPLYGRKGNPWGLKRQFLHAQSIEFSLPAQAGRPDRSRFKVEADLPDELQRIIDSLNEES